MNDSASLVAQICESAVARSGLLAVGVNAHVYHLARRHTPFRAMLEHVDLLYADGMSVVWASLILGSPIDERSSTTDLAPIICHRAAELGLKVHFLGGKRGTSEDAARKMLERYANLEISTDHGYYDIDDDQPVLAIEREDADIVFIGMGDPKQLLWAQRWRSRLAGRVLLTSGGLFDWLSQPARRAPSLIQRCGLEWLWRVALEPRRLLVRYLAGNPEFVLRVLRQNATNQVGLRRRSGLDEH